MFNAKLIACPKFKLGRFLTTGRTAKFLKMTQYEVPAIVEVKFGHDGKRVVKVNHPTIPGFIKKLPSRLRKQKKAQ